MAAHLTLIALLALQALATNLEQNEVKIGAPLPPMFLTRHAIEARSNITSQSYKSVALQVPIATVCMNSNNSQATNVFTPVAVVDNSGPVTTSATAPLPNGSSTTFAMLASRGGMEGQVLSTAPGPLSNMAQLVLGTDGCQTLHTPTTKAICSTLITPAGLPPVTITDCPQYITFSSEQIHQCSATPTISPLPADSSPTPSLLPAAAPTTSIAPIPRNADRPLKRQIALGRNGRPMMTDLVTVTPSGSASLAAPTTSSDQSEARPNIFHRLLKLGRSHLTSRQADSNDPAGAVKAGNAAQRANLSPPAPTKYYAAPWQQVLSGVPSQVKGITCYGGLPPLGDCTSPDTDGDTESCECSTADESWSVTILTQVRTGTSVASFSGPVVITSGTLTATTTISFQNTLTTTQTQNVTSIVKSTVSEAVVRITQTTIQSTTVSLISVTNSGMFAAMPQGPPLSTSDNLRASVTSVPTMATDASLAMDDVPVTTRVTSIVVQTVTVEPGNVKREEWPTNIWAANLPTGKAESESGDIDAVEKREEWPTNVWAANSPAATAKMVAVDGQNDVMDEEASYTVS